MLWWYVASRSGLLIRGDQISSLADDPRQGHNSCCSTRHNRCSSQHLAALLQHEGSWAKRVRNGSLVRHGPDHAELSQEHDPDVQCVWNQETQQHAAQDQLSPAVEASGQLLNRERRITRPHCEPHMAQSTQTTLPPCRRSTNLCRAEPSSRICNAAPRALAPEPPGHLPRVSCALGADRACKRALRAVDNHVSGWPGALATAGSRVAHAHAVSPSLLHAQGSRVASMSRRCMSAIQ